MKTTKTRKLKQNSPVRLSLTVQYAVHDDQLTRTRLRRWVQKALNHAITERLAMAHITLRLVDASESQALNSAYRSKNRPTNVLTFSYHDPDASSEWVADIVICTDVLKEEAHAQHKTYLDHAAHLVVHGTLHALGHDHIEATEAAEMEALEREILAGFSIADPYDTQNIP